MTGPCWLTYLADGGCGPPVVRFHRVSSNSRYDGCARCIAAYAMSRVTSAGKPYHLIKDAIIPPARVVPSGRTLVPPQAADNSGLFLRPMVWLLGRCPGSYTIASIISRLGVQRWALLQQLEKGIRNPVERIIQAARPQSRLTRRTSPGA